MSVAMADSPKNHRLIYPPERYDAELNLRIPLTFWLVLGFLLRHGILLLITFMPTTGQEITVLRDIIRPEYLLADAIALPVFISAIRRRPEAPAWMRRVWHRARTWLGLSVLSYLCLLGYALARDPRPLDQRLSEATLITLLLNLAILAYLGRSRLLKHLLEEWPEEPSPPGRTERP